MNSRWVILFAAVATDRSFTRAAARLNLAQPWLSAQVRKLESELGVPLFVREKNRIELTEAGERLLPLALKLEEAWNRFRAEARVVAAGRGEVVRIGAHVAAIGVPEFGRINQEFLQRYPAFQLEVDGGPTHELLERVRGGGLDLAFVLGPFDGDGLQAQLVKARPPYLLARRGALPSPAPGGLRLDGMRIGIIPRERHPAYHDAVAAALATAGAVTIPVPEPDGRAMEHFVRALATPVLMLENAPEQYAADRDLVTAEVPGLPSAEHYLVRPQNALAGRAADRYWRLAAGLAPP